MNHYTRVKLVEGKILYNKIYNVIYFDNLGIYPCHILEGVHRLHHSYFLHSALFDLCFACPILVILWKNKTKFQY